MQLRVTGFDHLVLAVADVERSLAWYSDVLGLAGVRVDEWRAGKAPFPSVRVSTEAILDLVPARGDRAARGNVDHFCLVVEPMDWPAVVAAGDLDVVEGPATRYGARGNGESLYVRDPDGNVVELRYYETP